MDPKECRHIIANHSFQPSSTFIAFPVSSATRTSSSIRRLGTLYCRVPAALVVQRPDNEGGTDYPTLARGTGSTRTGTPLICLKDWIYSFLPCNRDESEKNPQKTAKHVGSSRRVLFLPRDGALLQTESLVMPISACIFSPVRVFA